MSLANAVQSASPLPAPPDPSVFADALTLSFDSEPFHSGRSGEGFEPERVQVASAGSFSLGPATADILKRKPLPGVIEFRIIGKRDDSLNVAQPASLQVDPAADPGNVSNQGSLEPPPN